VNQPVPINIDQSRILVVDDDEIIRKLLRRVLERSGFVVDEAASGEAALDQILAHHPDLILLDVVMDGIDGFITCRKIKNTEGMEEVPIIFVTGRADTGSIVEGLDAGGSDYITKPINRHEALARIRNHLKMGELLKIVVEDEGPGIPEDEMHKLFTDFGKTSVQPTGNETSTGLGLSICKKIVESHKGRIYAANRVGSTGAAFTIELDVVQLAVQV